VSEPGRRTAPTLDVDTVTAALEVAVRAPSIHNTQPWRWRLDAGGLALRADRSRQLAVADPDGHSLLISCGATLRLAELALRAAGWRIATTILPDPDDPDLLATVRPLGRVAEPAARLAAAVDAALCRRSDRRPFAPQPVSEAERELLKDHPFAAAYLPAKLVPGTAMRASVAKDQDRDNLVAYLATLRK